MSTFKTFPFFVALLLFNPLTANASTTHNLLGIGEVVGHNSDVVNSTSVLTGTGILTNTTLSYNWEHALSNVFGLTTFTVVGEIDIMTGVGFELYSACDGDPSMCGAVILNQPHPILADMIFQDHGAGAIFWTDSDLLDIPPWGYADFNWSYSATELSLAPVAPIALPNEVPVPGAAWFFGSALIGLAGIKRKK